MDGATVASKAAALRATRVAVLWLALAAIATSGRAQPGAAAYANPLRPTPTPPAEQVEADRLFSAPPQAAEQTWPATDGWTTPGGAPPQPYPATTAEPFVGPAPMAGEPPYEPGFAPGGFGPATEDCPPGPWDHGPKHRPWLLRQFDLRHSQSHGRAMGPGEPLRGTSWLNRPYWVGLDGGALVMGSKPAPNVRKNNDFLAAASIGWDWDYYWGSQVRVAWATPELLNTLQTANSGADNLFITDLTLLYYPWGDSRFRPYYRFGLGLTDVEFTNDLGRRNHDFLFTLPIGVGAKYQLRRRLAWRMEFMNNIAIGQGETDTLNNLTFTIGLEYRLGGRPDSYWAWAPRGGAW